MYQANLCKNIAEQCLSLAIYRLLLAPIRQLKWDDFGFGKPKNWFGIEQYSSFKKLFRLWKYSNNMVTTVFPPLQLSSARLCHSCSCRKLHTAYTFQAHMLHLPSHPICRLCRRPHWKPLLKNLLAHRHPRRPHPVHRLCLRPHRKPPLKNLWARKLLRSPSDAVYVTCPIENHDRRTFELSDTFIGPIRCAVCVAGLLENPNRRTYVLTGTLIGSVQYPICVAGPIASPDRRSLGLTGTLISSIQYTV